MKRILALLSACLALALLAGCGKSIPSGPSTVQINSAGEAENDHDYAADVVIKEKMFIEQINDIYLNADDYMGKTIKYEGIFDIYDRGEGYEPYYYVLRYGPGCCGDDGNVGFEVVWDGDYPEQNDWVEVVGTPEMHDADGYVYLRLRISALRVLPTRGEEYVSQ